WTQRQCQHAGRLIWTWAIRCRAWSSTISGTGITAGIPVNVKWCKGGWRWRMYLTDMRLNPSLLVRFAHDHGHNRGSDEDLGYAVHAWLKASLGEYSPRTHQLTDLGARG